MTGAIMAWSVICTVSLGLLCKWFPPGMERTREVKTNLYVYLVGIGFLILLRVLLPVFGV